MQASFAVLQWPSGFLWAQVYIPLTNIQALAPSGIASFTKTHCFIKASPGTCQP